MTTDSGGPPAKREPGGGPRRERLQEGVPSVDRALATIAERWPDTDDAAAACEEPVFVLSAGWRSGSTLVQRLVVSGGSTLVWGEPYSLSGFVQRMAESLNAFLPDFPPDRFFFRGEKASELQDDFIANLYPHPRHLLDAHRAFFRTLLGLPASAGGYPRWGLKEVRLEIQHAIYLKWVFPRAKFLFVYRNPYDSYRSYRAYDGWFYRWPDDLVETATRFGEVWRSTTAGFLTGHQRVDGLLVKYEDLCSGALPIAALSEYLHTPIDASVMKVRVGAAPRRSAGGVLGYPVAELADLAREVEPIAGALGYRPASERES
jgi:hypothetical protein